MAAPHTGAEGELRLVGRLLRCRLLRRGLLPSALRCCGLAAAILLGLHDQPGRDHQGQDESGENTGAAHDAHVD